MGVFLRPDFFGIGERRDLSLPCRSLTTEYPAAWVDTGMVCAYACPAEKTLRKKRDRNGPGRAGKNKNNKKNCLNADSMRRGSLWCRSQGGPPHACALKRCAAGCSKTVSSLAVCLLSGRSIPGCIVFLRKRRRCRFITFFRKEKDWYGNDAFGIFYRDPHVRIHASRALRVLV